jgi:hypothetical protein
MFNKIWMRYWQWLADKHFYKGLKLGFETKKGGLEFGKYLACIDKKFRQ